MENYSDLKFLTDESIANDEDLRMYKSQLYQLAKCAQSLFEMLESGEQLEEWMKSAIITSYDSLEKVSNYVEYEASFPEVKDPLEDLGDKEKETNNYLTNEDKRFPVPQEGEGGDDFMGRCLADPAMKGRYPTQSDRFLACMLVFNKPPKNEANNPGEKFEDPMQPKDVADIDPDKPILP